MSLYHLVYQSRALVPLTAPELAQLLKQARAHNRQLLVTGVLLHAPDGRFLQVLEGEEADVRQLYYEHIRSDPRHYHCQVLGEGRCAERSFTKWDMGCRIAQAKDINALLQSNALPPSARPSTQPSIRPELMKQLLDFVGTKTIR
ncbi:BLUF domain-containing protein [Hymenobacter sp.]|uniref:BLUF domain-containing protein n=1 Tax=Hymenobacter sp. TaxID=1898978 RepID=UPI00286B4729|nr:BLUF domain-containing protein [Hymenobacter sp.]